MSIRRKLLFSFSLAVGVPLFLTFSLSFLLLGKYAGQISGNSLKDKEHISKLILQNQQAQLLDAAKVLARDNAVMINLGLGLYQALENHLLQVNRDESYNFLIILDPAGTILASTRTPNPSGNPFYFQPVDLRRSLEKGGLVYTMDISTMDDRYAGLFTLRGIQFAAVAPIINARSGLLGYVCLGNPPGYIHEYIRDRTVPMAAQLIQSHDRMQELVGSPFMIVNMLGVEHFSGSDSMAPMLSQPEIVNALSDRESQRTIRVQDTDYRYILHGLYGPNGTLVGAVGTTIATTQTKSLTTSIGLLLLAILALGLLAATGITARLAGVIARPIMAVADAANSIAKGDYDVRIQVGSRDEIGLMAEEFTVMTIQIRSLIRELNKEVLEHKAAEARFRDLNEDLETRVENRTFELTKANEALAESLALIRTTQKQLIEAEKQAALNTLVSGMAHEINTPIGNALTMSSYLLARTKELSAQLRDESLARSHLVAFFEELQGSMDLLAATMRRIADQVRFFKQIDVQQEQDQETDLRLARDVNDIAASLGSRLALFNCRIDNRIPQNLALRSFAGAIYQILLALFQNSLDHAFEPGQSADARITVESRLSETDSQLRLTVSDNGKGIHPDQLSKIFEPFYTTLRGSGHPGLGLSIVYNLVTARLGGQITCKSELGKGTSFEIVFPYHAGTMHQELGQ